MSQRITIQILNKIATCLTELPIVCGNSDYVAEFLFDDEWNGHSVKTARFRVNGEYTDVVFEDNECPIPIISNAKIVWVGVFAGELSTSTPAIVHCKASILDGEDVPAPPREDVYSQIVALCENAVEKAESIEERVNNGEFDGEDGLTPYIGENGNWWIGEEDTGVKASNAEAIQAETIQDVNELPSTDINEKSFYRLITVTFIHNRHVVDNSVCYCVDTLPEVGEPATDGKGSIRAYYNMSDGKVNGYLNSTLGSMFGIPAGWYDAGMLLNAQGWKYKGVISDLNEDNRDGYIRVLLQYTVHHYKDGKWRLISDFDVNEWLYPAMIKEQGYWIYSYNNLDLKNPKPDVIFSSWQLNDEHEWQIPERRNGIMKCATPLDIDDCANKEYVDDFASSILEGLNEIITAQNEILGG